ncbi:unnamed protein product [Rhizophagus irregularis]|nr:unnamed protein product [Rhizophagus irregularis]
MISENKENDRKSHKLDDDGGDVDGGICVTDSTILFEWNWQFFGDSLTFNFVLIEACKIWRTPITAYILGYQLLFLVVVIGLIIVEVKSAIIIPCDLYDKDILMEIRNCVGNVLFPYTMNRIIFDIIGSGYLPRDSKRCTCQIILTPHQDMVEQSLLYYAYKKNIRNTCVVFANQPSLCSGESINFIRNWENNSNIQ